MSQKEMSQEMQIYENVCYEIIAWRRDHPYSPLPKRLVDKDKAALEAVGKTLQSEQPGATPIA